jgi:TetR/AcrR family transcriptional regulator
MSEDRVERILDAAYQCFTRHGVRKTTMDDIAAAAGMSRPAVYQYVRNKEDAFRRLAERIFGRALDRAREAAAGPGTLTQRLDRILAVKLAVTQGLVRESPHAGELLGENSRIAADLDRAFMDEMVRLLTGTIIGAAAEAGLALTDENAREVAELALALTRGLEADLSDPDRPRERLRNGVALLVAGLAAAAPTSRTPVGRTPPPPAARTRNSPPAAAGRSRST